MSIFSSPDVKYDKSFVTHAIMFIQKNKIENFDDYKKKILIKIQNLKANKPSSKKMAELNQNRIQNEYLRLSEAEKIHDRVNDLKFSIFYMMKKIVVKNINNFHKLCRNSILGLNYSNDDEMENECFLIFETCVYKFDIENGNYDFYFYFNKAMSRSLYKIFTDSKDVSEAENPYSSFSYSETYSEEDFFDKINKKSDQQEHSIDFILAGFMNLTSDDMIVINSKIMKEPLGTFLKNNPKFTQKKYQNCLDRIKIELKDLQDE